MASKVTKEEKENVVESARKCGMNVSEFVRARALGYKPRAMLDPEERQALEKLGTRRADMQNLANALSSLNSTERLRLFSKPEIMALWLSSANDTVNDVNAFLREIGQRNRFPAGNKKEEKP